MNALKFTLSGRTAFFKKPDVNTHFYFTYGNIHKISLLGILGSIIGLRGYNQQKHDEGEIYPEFYEKFKNIKIGIAPKNNKGYIPKKIQTFNNSVGYANKDGGILNVKEQWLENPEWDIYVLLQGDIENELADRLKNLKFKYMPYLGKNDHFANIINVEILENVKKMNNLNNIDSLFIKDYFEFIINDYDPFEDNNEYISIYKYEEMLPISLEETTNKYNLETFIQTNSNLKPLKDSSVYNCDEKNIFFF